VYQLHILNSSTDDEEVFEIIWKTYTVPKSIQIKNEYGGIVFHFEIKDEVKMFYIELLEYARRHYMVKEYKDREYTLNRYKIAAAFIIAILKSRPIKKANEQFYVESSDNWRLNEELALFSGLAIIRQYIMNDLPNIKNHEEADLLRTLYEKSIPISTQEREKWESELYYLRREGCYNILSLAHELEDYTKIELYKAKEKREKEATQQE